MGDKAQVPQAPDYSELIAASTKVAERAQTLAEEQFAWAKTTYAENKGVTDGVVERFLQQMDTTGASLEDAASLQKLNLGHQTQILQQNQAAIQGAITGELGTGTLAGGAGRDTIAGTSLSIEQQRALEGKYTQAQIDSMDSNQRIMAANEQVALANAQSQLSALSSSDRLRAEQEALASKYTAQQIAQMDAQQKTFEGQNALFEQITNQTRTQLDTQAGITAEQQAYQRNLTAAQQADLQRNQQLGAAGTGAAMREYARADEDYKRYQDKFQPFEDRFLKEADSYASDARIAEERGRAVAGVNQQFDAARANAAQELESYGINRSATRFAALDLGARIQQGAAAAGAADTAGRETEATGREMRLQAIGLGQDTASRSAAHLGAAGQAAQGVQQGQQVNQQGAAANAGVIAQALDGLVRSGQLSSQVAQQIVSTTAQGGGQTNSQLMQLMENLQRGGQISAGVHNQLLGLFQSGGTSSAGNAGAGIGTNNMLAQAGYGNASGLSSFGLPAYGASFAADQNFQQYGNLVASILHGTTSSGASSMGTGTQWATVGNNALNTWGNVMGQSYDNQLAQYNAQQSASSGWGQILGTAVGVAAKGWGLEGGGAVPEVAPGYDDGGMIVPESSGLTHGAIPDDVPARLSPGEFVLPEETVRWFGEKHLHGIIEKAQRERAETSGRTGAIPVERQMIQHPPTFASAGAGGIPAR